MRIRCVKEIDFEGGRCKEKVAVEMTLKDELMDVKSIQERSKVRSDREFIRKPRGRLKSGRKMRELRQFDETSRRRRIKTIRTLDIL